MNDEWEQGAITDTTAPVLVDRARIGGLLLQRAASSGSLCGVVEGWRGGGGGGRLEGWVGESRDGARADVIVMQGCLPTGQLRSDKKPDWSAW